MVPQLQPEKVPAGHAAGCAWRLFFRGKQLEDHRNVVQSGVWKEATLHLIMRL